MGNRLAITVLDGYALNPGDLSWSALSEWGDVTIYDRTPSSLICERSKGATVLLTNKTPLDRETLLQLPHLRYIGVLATGYNVVDIATARERGILVCNVPGYGTASVVQLTFALLLELTHRVQRHADAVAAGHWSSCPDWSFWMQPLVEMEGKTFGIIGYGHIGQRVAAVAQAFGMNVVAAARPGATYPAHGQVTRRSLPDLLSASDVVSIHCPLTPDTHGLMNMNCFRQMRSTAFLLNTSRGAIVQEQDLAQALEEGVIAGAGLDVLCEEPPSAGNPLFHVKNCLITPHMAWATREARARLMDVTLQNLRAWLEGRPQHVVNLG